MYLKHAIHYIKCFLIDCLKFDKKCVSVESIVTFVILFWLQISKYR